MSKNHAKKRGFATRMADLFRTRRSGRTAPTRGRRLSLEPLETRTLLAIVSMSVDENPGTIVEREGGECTLTFTITPEEGDDIKAAGSVLVSYSISGLQPHEYEDGGCVGGSVAILTGQDETTAQVTIKFLNDAIAEGDDTCTIKLESAEAANPFPGGGNEGGGCCCCGGGGCCGTHVGVVADQEATVTILDDDHWAIQVEANTPDHIVEEDGVSGYTISRVPASTGRSGDTSYEIAVAFTMGGGAVVGADYSLGYEGGGSIPRCSAGYWHTMLPEGGNGVGVRLQSINDAVPESDKDAILSIVEATSVGYFCEDGGGCNGYFVQGGGSFGQAPGLPATVTIEDDDHWVVNTSVSDAMATERMPEVEQDTAAFLVSRTGDTDFSYGITVTYAISTGTDYATYDDYSLSLTDANGDAITGASLSVDTSENTCTVYFPSKTQNEARIAQMYIVVTPTFDWEDEADLYNPNGGGTPHDQAGERVALTMTCVTWPGLASSEIAHDPIGTTGTQEVEIKDGAILEAYLDYDHDSSLDVEESIADHWCVIRYNSDDDNANGSQDKDESAAVADENDLTDAYLYAWVENTGSLAVDVYLTLPTSSDPVKYWTAETKNSLFTPSYIGEISGGGSQTASFWIEGVAVQSLPYYLTATAYVHSGEQLLRWQNEQTALAVCGTSIDLDIDSDNNGYINTVNTAANGYRATKEDNLEENTAKPITFFGNYTLDEPKMAYVPIGIDLETLPADSEFSLWFDDTKLQIKTADDGTGATIASGDWMDASGDVTYFVKAIGASGSNLTITAKVRSEIAGVSGTEVLLDADRVLVAIQDNNTNMTDWVVPNGWLINGSDSVTTPTPTDEDAVGPKIEGTGEDYNSGDAYTRQTYPDGFELKFDISYTTEHLQSDNNGNEFTPDTHPADRHKVSLVGNSGIKIGSLDSDSRYEIAIIDLEEWLSLTNGLAQLTITGDMVDLSNQPLDSYESEEVSRLLPGMLYKGAYSGLTDADYLSSPLTSDDYKTLLSQTLTCWDTSSMIIVADPYATDGIIKVYMKLACNDPNHQHTSIHRPDEEDYYLFYRTNVDRDGNTIVFDSNTRVHIQSHWGSGVTLSNIDLTPRMQILGTFEEDIVACDPVLVAIQDNSENMSDRVVPNDWVINGTDSVSTPTPKNKKAIVPQIDGVGQHYNAYNNRDAYAQGTCSDGFELKVDISYTTDQVLADYQVKNKYADGQEELSFVGNTGIRIGGVDGGSRYQIGMIALAECLSLTERTGNLNIVGDTLVLDNQTSPLDDSVPEELSKLVSEMLYKGGYKWQQGCESGLTDADSLSSPLTIDEYKTLLYQSLTWWDTSSMIIVADPDARDGIIKAYMKLDCNDRIHQHTSIQHPEKRY